MRFKWEKKNKWMTEKIWVAMQLSMKTNKSLSVPSVKMIGNFNAKELPIN